MHNRYVYLNHINVEFRSGILWLLLFEWLFVILLYKYKGVVYRQVSYGINGINRNCDE